MGVVEVVVVSEEHETVDLGTNSFFSFLIFECKLVHMKIYFYLLITLCLLLLVSIKNLLSLIRKEEIVPQGSSMMQLIYSPFESRMPE